MLQIGLKTYASDALEDAMRLAQTKAFNSYTWSDCINELNDTWMDIFQQIAFVDEGYYSKTVRLTKKLTKLPVCVKNTIKVFAAQTTNSYNRELFRASGYDDLNGWNTYHISGWDLYCPDAERRTVWLNYVPQQPMLFYTRDNRDPKLYLDIDALPAKVGGLPQHYGMWTITMTAVPLGAQRYVYGTIGDSALARYRIDMVYRNTTAGIPNQEITLNFEHAMGYTATGGTDHPPDWSIHNIIADFPYVFVTYKNVHTDEHLSGFYKGFPDDHEFIEFNPFDYTGRNSNVEYRSVKWSDKTGMGAIVDDWGDMYINDNDDTHTLRPKTKELGWTPDSLIVYPGPEVYRLLVARLADKLAALNESDMMVIQKKLTDAEFAFKAFLGKDKSSWQRIDNVNGPTISDWL
jgi:hypothetical protein